jgi:hypothetical protein
MRAYPHSLKRHADVAVTAMVEVMQAGVLGIRPAFAQSAP